MIKVEKIIPGGQAIGTHEDGRKIFFWNALPGEIIKQYEITKKKSHYYKAIATEFENPSDFRVQPEDACYLATSPWQILDFDYENKLKAELVVEIFHEHHIDIELPELLTNHRPYFYRNKMEYALYWDKTREEIQLAFHSRGSHQKIPVTKSSLEKPEILSTAKDIIKNLNTLKEEARRYQSLILRSNQQGVVSGGLYENHQPHPIFKNLTDTILGQTYSYSPNGFFQINLPVYELALKEIKKYITTDKVLDLYAGVGTIGLSVARDKILTLVEVDKSAFREMAKNITLEESARPTGSARSEGSPVTTGRAERVRKGNILGLLDKSENVLNYIEPDQTVILDPPRAGCDKKLIDKLNEVKPATIVYLSCNPATQARDVKFLLENYQIGKIKTFNFFPRTPHIENLIILRRK